MRRVSPPDTENPHKLQRLQATPGSRAEFLPLSLKKIQVFLGPLTKMPENEETEKDGFWASLGRVFVAAINKGQFPSTILGLVLVGLVFRLPAESLGRITEQLVDHIVSLSLVGWILVPILLIYFAKRERRFRSLFNEEIKRVTDERNTWQKRAGVNNIESSGFPNE